MVKSRARLVSSTFGGLLTAFAVFVLLPFSAASASTAQSYHVQSGDTLWGIANRYHTTVSALASANGIANPDFIMAGQSLAITSGSTASHAARTDGDGDFDGDNGDATDPAPAPAASAPAPVSSSASVSGVWACIAQHESGGNPAENTGNGFYGAYQFTLSSWQAAGGVGLPQDQSLAYQTQIAQRLQQIQGWGAWPVTSRICGV